MKYLKTLPLRIFMFLTMLILAPIIGLMILALSPFIFLPSLEVKSEGGVIEVHKAITKKE